MGSTSAERRIGATWEVFRLTLRMTAAEFARSHGSRVAVLPLEPTDPERLAPLVGAVLGELERQVTASEASPVLRAIRSAFRPIPEEKSRRRLKKAFLAYAKAWKAKPAA